MSKENETPQITSAMAGTWLDGALGWHNAYRVVERAEAYGFKVPEEYQAALDDYRENHGPDWIESEDNVMMIHGQGDLSDQATDFLQEKAPEGYVFEWDAGELRLMHESEADMF
jgi:hypothetical protein